MAPTERLNLTALQRKGLHWFSRTFHLNITLCDQALVSGVNFLTGVLLARFMGIAEFGRFSLLWMLVLFFSSFQYAMIISPMMSIGPKQNPDAQNAYFGAVLVQQISFLIVNALLLIALLPVADHCFPNWHLHGLTGPIIAATLAYQAQEFLRRYCYTRKRLPAALLNDAISYLGQLGLLLALFFSGHADTAQVLWMIALSSLAAVGVGLFEFKGLRFKAGEQRSVLHRHWHFSKWLTASNLMTWVSGNFLMLTAGAVLGTSAAGVLKACQNILGITHILFNALANLVPIQAGTLLAQQGLAAMEQYFRQIAKWGGAATFLLAIPALCFPKLTLQAIYGPAMTPYAWVLSAYALVYLVMFINQILTFALRTLEQTRPIFNGYCLTAILSLLSANTLATRFGLSGIALGFLVLAIINMGVLIGGYIKDRNAYAITHREPDPAPAPSTGGPDACA